MAVLEITQENSALRLTLIQQYLHERKHEREKEGITQIYYKQAKASQCCYDGILLRVPTSASGVTDGTRQEDMRSLFLKGLLDVLLQSRRKHQSIKK
jgi:hypothetical protein